MEPRILTNVFDPATRAELLAVCDRIYTHGPAWDNHEFGRIGSNSPALHPFLSALTVTARDLFDEPELLPTYCMWALYDNPTSRLPKHKDDNACTFTIDYCVRQNEPWPLFVEGKPYVLQPNQALVFLGEEQEHWREEFSPGNRVEMIFFHFARPDHWYFTG